MLFRSFSTGEARWLGVTLQGEEEQPRILLVSVPYALKAADADTLGGKPASAFVVAESTAERSATTADTKQAISGTGTTALIVNPGNVGDIVKYTGSPDTLGPATNFVESGGNVGVGTTAPGARLESFVTSGGEIPLRLNTNFGGGNAVDFYPYIPGVSNDGFQLSVGGTGRLWMRPDGKLGLGTTVPGARLESFVTSGGDIPLRLNTNFGGGNAVDFYPYIPGVSNGGFQLSLGGIGRFWISSGGNVGIGTASPSASLELAGQIKITGGSPGAGKFLTSDASGLASWTTAAGSGTVTSIAAGSGLAASPGSPITGSGTRSEERRVGKECRL